MKIPSKLFWMQSVQRFIHIKNWIRENEKSVKNIAHIDKESPLMSYQRKSTFNFLVVILT